MTVLTADNSSFKLDHQILGYSTLRFIALLEFTLAGGVPKSFLSEAGAGKTNALPVC
jgi:hypothetical protein